MKEGWVAVWLAADGWEGGGVRRPAAQLEVQEMQCFGGLLGSCGVAELVEQRAGENGTKKGAVQKEERLVYGMNPLAGGVRNPPQHQATVVAVVDRGSAVIPSAPDLVDKENKRAKDGLVCRPAGER
jgi:hypothetical protein